MSLFPVIAEEVDSAESMLGIRLPSRYKELLGDPRIQKILLHPKINCLSSNATMQSFVDITRQVRHTMPGFPRGGVVAMDAGSGRYMRFWMPDAKAPGALGEMIYMWDTVKQKRSKDCTNDEWVNVMIRVLHDSDPDFFAQVGYPLPEPVRWERLVHHRKCADDLLTLMAQRGDALRIALATSDSQWHHCAFLDVKGRYLDPCDLGQLPQGSSDWALKISPGLYRTEVKVALSALGEWPVISALRVVLDGAKPLESVPVSSVGVDLASIAIYDRQTFFKQVPLDNRDAYYEELLDLNERPCVAVAGKTAEVLVVPTGDGDGTYPVLELRNKNGTVGLEIHFTPDAKG